MTERQTLYVFRLGEAYDDLEPVFAVDGRDYPDDETVRADVRAASAALADRRLIADFETSTVPPEAPRIGLPSWPQWRARHIDGAEPIGVRPRPDHQPTPPGWDAMGRWLEGAQAWLSTQVAAAAGAAGGTARALAEPEPHRVGRASVVLAEERYRVDCEYLAIPPDGGSGPVALQQIAAWLNANDWQVAPAVETGTSTTIEAANAGYTIAAVWNHRGGSVWLRGSSPTVDATHFDPAGGAGAAHV
ncbi:hypothetical protein [Dactylosporangium sp. CA-092794]|uniref:hypothetical protein n=1 Tax=Dactylosporangium sp. CA-092794 TaxID=3239929 RepID=UPI003D8A514F